jgi:hypothetical protein
MTSRADAASQVLLKLAQDAGFWVSPDGRIGLRDAATLLGLSPGTLRNLCAADDGPPTYRLGGHGHRVTVGLIDLAAWRESRLNRRT